MINDLKAKLFDIDMKIKQIQFTANEEIKKLQEEYQKIGEELRGEIEETIKK